VGSLILSYHFQDEADADGWSFASSGAASSHGWNEDGVDPGSLSATWESEQAGYFFWQRNGTASPWSIASDHTWETLGVPPGVQLQTAQVLTCSIRVIGHPEPDDPEWVCTNCTAHGARVSFAYDGFSHERVVGSYSPLVSPPWPQDSGWVTSDTPASGPPSDLSSGEFATSDPVALNVRCWMGNESGGVGQASLLGTYRLDALEIELTWADLGTDAVKGAWFS
jgi:hypothetical protein